MWLRKSPKRELLIKMPIKTVSIVGSEANIRLKTWGSFIPETQYQHSGFSLTSCAA